MFPTNVRASDVAGAVAPRPQAGRGLLGVKLLLIEIFHSFRCRILGGNERFKPWTTTITNGSVVIRRISGTFLKVCCSWRGGSIGSFASSPEAELAKRRPLLIEAYNG